MRACWWRLSRVRRSKKVSNDSPSSSITHKLAAIFFCDELFLSRALCEYNFNGEENTSYNSRKCSQLSSIEFVPYLPCCSSLVICSFVRCVLISLQASNCSFMSKTNCFLRNYRSRVDCVLCKYHINFTQLSPPCDSVNFSPFKL